MKNYFLPIFIAPALAISVVLIRQMNGKPTDEAVHSTCFHGHEPAKDRDFVFTRYSP